ncbi:MAG: hypothetical protein MUO76_19630, partial [Anaerolineaceae bacterium]|nr:hypothetical protein [Anaerolineaceae bacterium]
GMMIRFSEKDVRPMGLVAAGVNGMKLAEGDYIVSAERLIPGMELFFLASTGDVGELRRKRSHLKDDMARVLLSVNQKGKLN